MKKFLTAAAAAGIALALPLGMAVAQNNDAPGLNNQMRGNADLGNSQDNFGAVISAMNNAKASTEDISGLTDAATVNVIRVDTKGANQAAFDNAMTRNEGDITSLRTAIQANATLWQKLQAENVTLEQIVGIDTQADGTVNVYVSS